MSAYSETRAVATAKKRFRAKPHSVQRRFQLMQLGTVVVALVLASLALYWNLSSQEKLSASLARVHATLVLSREVQSAHEAVSESFWAVYESKDLKGRADFEKRSAEALSLLNQYDKLSLSGQEAGDVDKLRDLGRKFYERTAAILSAGQPTGSDHAVHEEVEDLSEDVDHVVQHLESLQIARLESHGAGTLRISIAVSGLLVLFAGFSLFAIGWFRREQRRHLWSHLDSLRRMVSEIRHGNLNVAADIPDSVELGSLMGAFVQMAAELRDSRDSLERKVLERTASLEVAQKELLQSAKLSSLGQLVSGVAHEINNPLTAILGFSEVALFRSAPGSSLNSQLRTIRSEALRMRHIVGNLSAFARRAPHRNQRFDLRTLITRVTDLHGYELRVNNISLDAETAWYPVWVTADPDQLTQVMLNLLLNAEDAIKSSRDRGAIWLACGASGNSAFFSVRDNGCGIPPEVRDRMFEPFFTTKPTGQGTGLGLSISYGIVQQHHGSISVESALGEGATFRVQLPLAREEAPDSIAKAADVGAPPRHNPAPDPSPTVMGAQEPNEQKGEKEDEKVSGSAKGLYVLVIDDEESILEMVLVALEPLNCRVTLLNGSSGVEAALAANYFDLVISDLKMPGQNGAEIFRFIRQNYPALASRFLLMSGNLADAEKYADELKAVTVLPKPFTVAHLRRVVTDLLQKATA
jgi:signal transduction histidine kinase/CheY-like chemotaxis protein